MRWTAVGTLTIRNVRISFIADDYHDAYAEAQSQAIEEYEFRDDFQFDPEIVLPEDYMEYNEAVKKILDSNP